MKKEKEARSLGGSLTNKDDHQRRQSDVCATEEEDMDAEVAILITMEVVVMETTMKRGDI